MFMHSEHPIHLLNGLSITLLECNIKSARLSLVIINDYMVMGLLRRNYYLNEQDTKYVSIYLNDDGLKPQVKIGTSGHTVLNEVQ